MTDQTRKNTLDAMTAQILRSYRSHKDISRVGQQFLPSRQRIVAGLERIRQLIFPGYFNTEPLDPHNVRYFAGSLLITVRQELTEQVYHCLCYESDAMGGACRDRASGITEKFLKAVPRLRKMLQLDAQAAYDGDPAAKSIDEVIFCYPGFYAISVYRIAHELLSLGVPLMPRIMTEHAHSLTGTDIHPGAKIGKRFFIDHATGVVIGETTAIGDNVKIYQGVTLGALSIPKDERNRAIKGLKRHPTIEDNITVYANATILGGQTRIGAGVTIGANTFITQSIAPKTTVMQKAPELHIRTKGKKTDRQHAK